MGGNADLPVVDPADLPEDAGDVDVHGVVLAAGESRRYGDRNKLLTELEGEPLVVHATRPLVESAVTGVTVVVGFQASRVRDALSDLSVSIRENPAYVDGQSTSVAIGVRAARERGADAVLIALGDMPRITGGTIDTLVAAYAGGVGDAIAAAYDGIRGNPVVFDSRYFDPLLDVDGDVGGREILLGDSDAVAVETGDPGVVHDVDSPADL